MKNKNDRKTGRTKNKTNNRNGAGIERATTSVCLERP